jgi:alpha-maltose-1-phosphate synthase
VRILYVASDQVLPGRTGGSVHVLEVGRGLAARGHEVHAVVKAQPGAPDEETLGALHVHRVSWQPFHRFFRFRARATVRRLAERLRPDVFIERYYNFGGEGVGAAVDVGRPVLLEVNSPVVDHAGSWKGRLDAALIARPMRRWREWQCEAASALVAPLREIVPRFAQAKTEVVTWGANVEDFRPDRRSAAVRRELGVPDDALAVLFSGSFRPWHGVHVLEEAARRLQADPRFFFVLAGGATRGAGDGFRGVRLGTVPYERMPDLVASCDVGTAPYDTARLAQLQLGFFWSPLKVFEYMASGLPTVAVASGPLREILRHGEEGLHVGERDPAALVAALVRLAEEPALRERLGAAARTRVVERYSWQRHCAQLEGVLQRIAA